ncbi:hypothetical protein [Paenibacillus sp. MMO-58]|uniref:hypothetical protein n=1 Tax=Paenibacillus sp. MMO-58 TaxID=3081290 RepID=UPI00301855C9
MGTIKKYLAMLLIVMIGVSGLPLTPIFSAASDTVTATVKIPFSKTYNSNEFLSNVSVNLSKSGYKVKSYQVWKKASNSDNTTSLVNKATYGASLSGDKIIIPSFQGAKIGVTASGYTSTMYFATNRTTNGKQWQFTTLGTDYSVTPDINSSCWVNGVAECAGILNKSQDDHGKAMTIDKVRTADGWAVSISDGFPGPSKYKYNADAISSNDIIPSSITITKATINGADTSEARVVSKGKGKDGYGQLSVATPLTKDNSLGKTVDCNGCSGKATAKKYSIDTSTEWAAQTYLFEGEVRVTYEPIPPANTPYVSCDCKANPETVEFDGKDVAVSATLNASLSAKGTKTVQSWTVYGRAEDGSQYTTSTVGYGLDSISQKFSFTISKTKLDGKDSYTETWVMRARVNFTDGTTAEQPIECMTVVTRPGTATPDPSASPTPPPAPPVTADVEFIPNTIITGDQSTLDNNSDGYTSMTWTFTDNLKEVITDSSQYRYSNVKFDKPGFYQAKIMVTNGTETKWDTASLQVIDPKPVAVVTGPTKVIQGRDFSNIFHLYNSYTPLADRGVKIDFTKNEMRYKKVGDPGYTDGWPSKGPSVLGDYSIEGKVFDSQGRVSDWGTHLIEVVPDQPPVVTLVAPSETYRYNDTMLYIDAKSVDGDTITDMQLEERYDRDNDGNFEEEPWTVIYTGPYKDTYPITFTSVGKRQYRATVKEDYGLAATSDLAGTNVLNYAPYVDFDVSGLTQQPDQGDGSAPEDITYTGESIMRSWKLVQPYTTNTNKPIGWLANSGALQTKNAKMADFFIKYPNMGLGANSRSKYELASDLTNLPVWGLPVGAVAVPYIYAGHRLYSREGAEMVERNSQDGKEISRFSLSEVSGLTYLGADKNENFYYGAGSYGATNYEVKKINNHGQLIGSYTIPISGEMSYIMYFEVSDDGQNLYMAYRARVGATQEYWNVHAVKYSVLDNSVKWDVKTGDLRYSPTFLQNYKGVIDSDGDLYLTWTTQTTYDGYELYAMAVNGNTGVMGYQSRGTYNADISYMVASPEFDYRGDRAKYLYFTVSGYVQYSKDSSMGTSIYGFMFNKKTGYLSRISYPDLPDPTQYGLESWNTCETWCDKMSWEDTMGVGTPIIYPDGSVYATVRYAWGDYKFDKYLNLINKNTQGNLIANTKAFLMPSGNIAFPDNGALADSWEGTYKPYASIKANGRAPIDRDNNYYGSKTYYSQITDTKGDWASSALKDPTLNTSILPDGSFYGFSKPASSGIQYVFPFVPASGSGDYPKVIDANTIEIVDSTWAGLWYDPATKLKNDRLSFNVAVNDSANDKPIGAGIHIQDGKNMYAAEWTSNKVTLYKVVAGVKTALQSADVTRSPFVTYPFEIEASNGTLRVYINHAKVIEIADSTFKQGSVGLMSLGQQQAKFTGMKVKNYGDFYIEETVSTVLVDEEIKYDTIFDDIEKDPQAKENWSYKHDPNYFANSLGLSQYDGKSFDTRLPSLDKPGLYEITYKASDNPGIDAYSAWSEPVIKKLYVHRRPIAQPDVRFTGIVYPEGETLDYLSFDTSYDPDIPDVLSDRVFRTRWADEATWTPGMREIYSRPGVELIIQEQVKDTFGVWSTWAETRVYKDALPPVNQNPPKMVITNPTGTLTTPTVVASEPVIKWTYSDAENDPQEQFYLKVTYVDTGKTITEVTYPGNDTSYILDEGIQQGRKVKVQGRVYSKGKWSSDSNIVYFILNTPPVTHLLSFNGPKASAPIYTNNNRPKLSVSVSDFDGQPITKIDYEVFHNATGNLVVDTNGTIGTTDYTPLALQEGLHNWRARAYDGMAWGDYSENGYFFVDTVPPDDTNEQLEIKPTSVKVTFNPFSDATPSSGHASRAFYMQKVNDDGSTTNIDLNGNGTTEYNISIPNTSTSYTVNGLQAGKKYRLMVVDWDVAGNMGQYQYIYFTTNQPPAADFDWSPKPVYEGDDIQLKNLSTDPDGDAMTYAWTVSGPAGYYSKSFTTKDVTIPGSVTENHAGKYIVTLQATDALGLASEVISKTITVNELGITAAVTHTPDWEKNRQTWNTKMPDAFRPDYMFWAGERFVLSSRTTDTGTSSTKAQTVRVTAKYIGKTSLSSADKIAWSGYIGEENADVELETISNGDYVFSFVATYSNGVVKQKNVTITIQGNWTEYFKFHKSW